MCDSELGGARERVDKLMAGHEAKRRSGNEKRRGKKRPTKRMRPAIDCEKPM
jgi:hypothetical protein